MNFRIFVIAMFMLIAPALITGTVTALENKVNNEQSQMNVFLIEGLQPVEIPADTHSDNDIDILLGNDYPLNPTANATAGSNNNNNYNDYVIIRNRRGTEPMCRRHWGYFENRRCVDKVGEAKTKCKAKRKHRCQRCCGCGGFPAPDKSKNGFNKKLFAPEGKACNTCCKE